MKSMKQTAFLKRFVTGILAG